LNQHSLPIPAYTSKYDPLTVTGYTPGVQVTSFDEILATRAYAT